MASRYDALETLIDQYPTLTEFLAAVSDICHEKAEHIASNWQDAETAKAWRRTAVTVAKASAAVDV